ncbi:MAG: DUF4321 domain-containing protein [Oscillospiraceae bacterium]|nr:DUF4321 domain-containing protein [Oscillospiraceae bacterium]MBQ4311812.1 DUF4321 domain-containing protein [Oscillospiraceae bacterium]MBQ5418155.1 DUF4321 domain-containing protein [Oscillospiraceae bacterium]MCR5165955.1 DUF4321 domain-containing protein [Oscillospiraceae bacterium]
MKNASKILAFLFFLLAGIVTGTVIGKLCAGTALSFLSYTMSVGFSTDSPAVLDLIILKLCFGFELSVNVSQILCTAAALLIYGKTSRGA